MTSVTISTIRNSCIVNNANIAVQNKNITHLDAMNNWWGMPTGATHDNIPSGDAVGQNIFHAPHLPTMPFLCDLTSADWIPFSEQELQHAINSHIPYLGGIAFALIDFEWGRGAKFDILTHPNYGNLHDVAYISIKPNPTGDLITLQLDITRLPTDETIQKIVTCELMPLFVNSIQQVQNRYVSPSQNIASMVVMERDLMMRFTPPTEITPDPASEFVLNYDASCLPSVTALPTPTPSPTPIQNEDESGMLVTIPPLEGEFALLTENNEEGENEPQFEIKERLLFHVAYPYPSQHRGIYSADPITGEVYNLLDVLNIVGEVALSPSGDYIVFTGFVAGSFNHFGMFIMRSDGTEVRSLGNIGTNYRHIGWTHEADNQWVTFSVGTEEIAYAMQPTQNIADAIVVIPDGIRPKWIGLGVNKVIYTSDNHLFIAEFNPSTFEIVTTPEQITPVNSPTGVGHYEWSDNGNDVIFEENNQLWRYRDGWVTLINQTSNGATIGNREFMTRPNTNHIATVLGHFEIGYDGALYHVDNIQRIHLSTYTIQFANPLHFVNNTPTDWHNWGDNRNLHRPFLSPYRNGNTVNQDLYFVECDKLLPTNCYYSYILDANTLTPRAIFQNTPIAGVPAIAWQEFRLPAPPDECPTPGSGLSGIMGLSTTQSIIPENCQVPPTPPTFPIDCSTAPSEPLCLFLENDEVFSYVENDEIKVLNRINDKIEDIPLPAFPNNITNPSQPSWGKFNVNVEEDGVNVTITVYRLAFGCTYDGISNALCYWDSNIGYYRLDQPGVSYFERIDMTSDGKYVATDSNPRGQIQVYEGGTSLGYIADSKIPNFSTNDMLYYIHNDGTLGKFGDPIMPAIQPISDFYDVRDGEIIYWDEGNEIKFIKFVDNSGVITPLQAYSNLHPMMLSPTSQINSYKLIVVRDSGTANACVELLRLGTANQDVICLNNIGTNFDWDADINLDFLKPRLPQPIPTRCLDLSRDIIAEADAIMADCVEELSQYKIRAFVDGLPLAQPENCLNWKLGVGKKWTPTELRNVLTGVHNTAKAFYMLRHNLYGNSNEYNIDDLKGTSLEEKQLFSQIMDAPLFEDVCEVNGELVDVDVDGFYMLRVENSFMYNNDKEYCDRGTSDQACTSNANHAIALYGTFFSNNDYIPYIIVHELGHRFNNQSALGNKELRLSKQVDGQGVVIKDINTQRVMGRYYYEDDGVSDRDFDWVRGTRGWGDNQDRARFQQNPTSIAYPNDEIIEIEEATADLFLNWVYRYITDEVSDLTEDEFSNPSVNTWENIELLNASATPIWEGFRNINGDGNFDATLPGNARYWWMYKEMKKIFNRLQW